MTVNQNGHRSILVERKKERKAALVVRYIGSRSPVSTFFTTISRPLVIWHTIKLHYKTANAHLDIYSLGRATLFISPFIRFWNTAFFCLVLIKKKYKRKNTGKKLVIENKKRQRKISQRESGENWHFERFWQNKNCRKNIGRVSNCMKL